MKTIQVDRRTLKSPPNYARSAGLTRQGVHQMIQEGKLVTDSIDGLVFVVVDLQGNAEKP